MGWFDDNSAAPGGGQNATADDSRAKVTALYKQYYGRAPTARELAGWGDNIDNNYANKIATQLRTSTEGTAYQKTAVKTRLNGLYQELVGRDATQEELDKYGTNIDDNYFNKIRTSLAGSDEAKTYEANPKKAGTTTPATTGDDWAAKDYSNADNVKAYAKSRGVDMSDETAQYWAGKYNSPEFAKDRNYFFQRLSTDPAFGGGQGGPDYGSLLDPYTKKFTYDDFKPPTAANDQNDPGFTTRMQAVQDTLQRSAAAKGSLLSGSTTKAVTDASSDYASNEYQNVYNRDLQTYGTNRGNAYDQYKEDRANFYQNQDSPYAKLMGMASLQEQDLAGQRQLNLGYAQAGANTIMGGAGAYNGLLTGGANAAASGVVGQNNSYQSLYGMAQQYPWMFMNGRGSGSNGGGFGSQGRGTAGNPNGYWPPY